MEAFGEIGHGVGAHVDAVVHERWAVGTSRNDHRGGAHGEFDDSPDSSFSFLSVRPANAAYWRWACQQMCSKVCT